MSERNQYPPLEMTAVYAFFVFWSQTLPCTYCGLSPLPTSQEKERR